MFHIATTKICYESINTTEGKKKIQQKKTKFLFSFSYNIQLLFD